MDLSTLLKTHDMSRSLLLGFYGGGNYGDELLLEILAGLFKKQGFRDVAIAFQHPGNYHTFHHEFGYPRVNMHDKLALLKAILRKKRIVVGGGGLWGLDANANVLLMGVMLFISRWLLGKKVYLLAVGYYNSSPPIGKVAAWFAGKAANVVIARDNETFDNFKKITKHVHLGSDIAWHVSELDLTAYESDSAQLEKQLRVEQKTLFITLRRFKDTFKNQLVETIEDTLKSNQSKPVIVAIMEPQSVDPAGYMVLQKWRKTYKNVQVIDFSFNPLALFLFFRTHHDKLIFIGPQFHAILSAHLTGVPYMPLAYDNKVHNLLRHIAPASAPIAVQTLVAGDVQRFIDTSYRATV